MLVCREDTKNTVNELTSARKSIACESSAAIAGVISLKVDASCIVITAICAFSTFIHICSSNSSCIAKQQQYAT